jgi:hypothetical protein
LFFLESIQWAWDINTVLQQPEDLARVVIKLKAQGVKITKDKKK